MKKRILYIAWGCMYALCAGLGHINAPGSAQSAALTLMALLFFVPPGILLIDALRTNNTKTLLRLRFFSMVSLGLTFILLILNVSSMLASEVWGTVLHEILILVSVPMICSQHWVLSMFLWAALLFATLPLKKHS